MENSSVPYPWPLEAIWETVSPQLPGFTAEMLPQVDSTNSELMRRARAGLTDPILLVAERQTAGRGRSGKTWLGGVPSAQVRMPSLSFSLGLRLQCADWSGLSLVVGLSVLQALVQAQADVPALGLKWPNDLWWQGRKLAGILIETAGGENAGGRYAVIGIGINIDEPPLAGTPVLAPGTLPPALPVGLQTVLPGMDAARTLAAVVPCVVRQVCQFERVGFGPFAAEFAAWDLLQSQPVILSDGRHGVARGVDATGALRVDVAGVRHSITSGEVSVRPLHNAATPMNGQN